MYLLNYFIFFFFSSRRRHTRLQGDWSSDVCSSDLEVDLLAAGMHGGIDHLGDLQPLGQKADAPVDLAQALLAVEIVTVLGAVAIDRKSTRLNSSHLVISYAVFCLKKKKTSDSKSQSRVDSQPLPRTPPSAPPLGLPRRLSPPPAPPPPRAPSVSSLPLRRACSHHP